MDQPSLPDIDPYVNRNLFSDHFLKELLPQGESWHVDEDKLRLAMQAAANLCAGREEEWARSNESQLEDKLVRPMLGKLEHRFEVQTSLPTVEGRRWPDYAFFATDEDRREALDFAGAEAYFSKAIGIGDAKRWGQPLDRLQGARGDKFDRLNPSWQIDYYLRMSGTRWAILTNGRLWRLYSRETSFRLDTYYEIDLVRMLAAQDLEVFKYFYLFFRRHAFEPDARGLCFLDQVYQGSLKYARAVGDDLKENVYKALRLLAEGFLRTSGNDLDPARDLEEIYANSLVLLYRLLFINYAEDRGLLPRDDPSYRDDYGLVSIEGVVADKLDRRESLPQLKATYWETLTVLFKLINEGSESPRLAKRMPYVPPYNGGLFDPNKHPFLEKNKVADYWLARVVDLLARSQGQGTRKGRVDYSSLDVRHLGSIYEGLLEYKLRVAEQEMAAVKRGGKEHWMPSSESGSSRVLERVGPGSAYLATDRGERKATGSYYTPDYIVKYIVEHTVGPLIEEKMKEDDPIQGILSLKVLDPAMGSGHFLVEATDRLAHALVEALGGTDEQREEDDVRWARREVVERCIYGVDVNPLAVELAKLSLWLHTVAEGRPLSFLDHHLRVGNSLIGAWVQDLERFPVRRAQAESQEGQPALFEHGAFARDVSLAVAGVKTIQDLASDTVDSIREKDRIFREITREHLNEWRRVADLWTSGFFGSEITQEVYANLVRSVRTRDGWLREDQAQAYLVRADDASRLNRFFHWELEFPEVFYDRYGRHLGQLGGFDAVIGNPPYANVEDLADDEKRWLRASDSNIFNNKNDQLYHFVSRAIRLSSSVGRVGMIISRYVTEAHYAEAFRSCIAHGVCVREWSDFGNLELFEGVNTRCVVFLMSPGDPDPMQQVLVTKVDSWDAPHRELFGALSALAPDASLPGVERFSMPQSELLRPGPWTFLDARWRRIRARIEGRSISLGGDSGLCRIGMGWNTGMDQAFTLTASDVAKFGREAEHIRPLIKNGDIRRFQIEDRQLFWIDTNQLDLSECPLIAEHLAPYRSALSNRYAVRASGKRWYEYAVVNMPDVFLAPEKIIVPFKAPENRFALDTRQALASQDVYAMKLASSGSYCHEYLLAILNSSPMTRWYQILYGRRKKAEFDYYSSLLERIPIRRIEFKTSVAVRQRVVREAQDLFSLGDLGALLDLVDTLVDAQPERADVVHDLLVFLARQMMQMNGEKQEETSGFVDWLAGYTGVAIEDWRLKTTVQSYWRHGWEELMRAVRENSTSIKGATGRNAEGREAQEAIKAEYEKSMAKLTSLLERIAWTDRLIDLIVYRLYGLTEEEVAMVQGGP